MKIADFFKTSQETTPPSKVQPSKSGMSVTSKSSLNVISKSKVDLAPVNATKPTQMTINLKLEKPDIILVEHMDNIDTNAIIVNVSIYNQIVSFNCLF